MGFWSWWVEPIEEIINEVRTPIIELREPESTGIIFPEADRQYSIFRPENFDQYIGQERAKTILKDYITAVKERGIPMGHILLYGPAGTGKTTLARIIAKELGIQFNEIIASTIVNSVELLIRIQMAAGGVIFIDEIHALPRSLGESIYTAMEEFKYDGKPISPFTLIGATTELGELVTDRAPFVERFSIPLELEDYKIDELALIAEQYKKMMYPKDIIPQHLYSSLALNSRLNPRTMIRLIQCLIFMKSDISKVLYNFNIIKEGYTHKDLKALKYIQLNEKGVGLEGLASYLGTSKANYTMILEPYLLKNNLIIRSPRGRRITDLGKQKIIELEK